MVHNENCCFLTDLAVRGKVSASTQNQAMNALVFLCRKVLETHSRCRRNAPFPQTADTFLPGGRDAALHVRQGCLTLPCALGMKLFAIKYERFRMMAVNKPE